MKIIVHGHLSLLLMVACLDIIVSAGEDSIVLPPVTLGPNTPKCTSYGSLCHLAYNITDKDIGLIFHSHSQVCQCPDDLKCPVDWFDMSNSFIKSFRNEGKEMQVKVSYCKMYQPERRCREDEPAVIIRGRGPFQFEIVQDFQCYCNRPLYAHTSWQYGPYDYFIYSCGKPRCSTNRHPETRCTEVKYVAEENFQHEYLCRCKWYEQCIGNVLPTAEKPITYKHCQPMQYHDSYFTKPRQFRPKASKRKRHLARTS